jgi:hypothetical protein
MGEEKHLLSSAKLVTQADAIIYFLQKLDIEMVSDILDDNRTYQDFKKYIFIHKLGNALSEFIAAGDTFLNCYSGFCNAEICNYKCSGFSFIGNNSKNYLNLIIDIKDGIVHDMYECSIFKNHISGIEKSHKIKIDKSYF